MKTKCTSQFFKFKFRHSIMTGLVLLVGVIGAHIYVTKRMMDVGDLIAEDEGVIEKWKEYMAANIQYTVTAFNQSTQCHLDFSHFSFGYMSKPFDLLQLVPNKTEITGCFNILQGQHETDCDFSVAEGSSYAIRAAQMGIFYPLLFPIFTMLIFASEILLTLPCATPRPQPPYSQLKNIVRTLCVILPCLVTHFIFSSVVIAIIASIFNAIGSAQTQFLFCKTLQSTCLELTSLLANSSASLFPHCHDHENGTYVIDHISANNISAPIPMSHTAIQTDYSQLILLDNITAFAMIQLIPLILCLSGVSWTLLKWKQEEQIENQAQSYRGQYDNLDNNNDDDDNVRVDTPMRTYGTM